MSTKIYYGYRMSPKTFEKVFLPAFRDHAVNYGSKILKKLLKTLKDDSLQEFLKKKYDFYKKENSTFEEFKEEYEEKFKYRFILEHFQEASARTMRSFHDIDASLNVWFYKSKFYVIPYGNCVSSFVVPEGIEDYKYYNNSDKPRNISDQEWEKRCDTWEKVCLEDWNLRRMTHNVINAKEEIGLLNILQLHFKKDDCYMYMPFCVYECVKKSFDG